MTTHFGPRSLLGQTMLALAVALLGAQAIYATLLYRAADERREVALLNAAAFELISGPYRTAGPPGRRLPGAELRNRFGTSPGPRAVPRPLRYRLSAAAPIAADEHRSRQREAQLGEVLARQGIAVGELKIVERPALRDPEVAAALVRAPRWRERVLEVSPHVLVVALKRSGAGVWEVVRLPVPRMDRGVITSLLVQTLILFAVLMAILYGVLRRLTGPLAILTRRTAEIARPGAPAEPLAPQGPDDVRQLIAAHNAMEARIGAMLAEKDVMLGAIGHDLKTPLAALRVRIESVEDDAQRSRMAATIEDITRTLDEILELARIGRAANPPERAAILALADSVVEEFEDMGEPVELADGPRVSARVHVTWLKRALRNLISNALRYGGNARVTVLEERGEVVLRVDDDGPGIPADRIDAMTEPFVRGEASRSRATGGTGLGLTLARAIAEERGGRLVLANRPEGGLRAELRFPR
ncbi:sensor histidine kinase [Qipengyuania sediminis]|uniref:sensor histidine kinase n=1 Tax=Qipengyuania sediminis TaxID=1532023 RepID=UPI001059C375|nr:HAMP domain-containing sensor histidine kinase [Qipengyuania sediminis]